MTAALSKRRRRWPLLTLAGLLVAAAIGGAALGRYLRFGLPSVSSLEDYAPPVITRVLASDGSLLDTFAEQRRILIESRDIPQVFTQALIAVEDSGFYRHTGFDFQGILRAAWRNLSTLRKLQGASTLTQQLARNLFLHREKTFRRKVQEVLLATEIERQYTKEEILRFYCNQIYWGHGRYGLEAATRFYLGKPARELNLPQAALLAGMIQRPEDFTPFKNPEAAMRRRNHVLHRMVVEGYLTPEQAAEARQAALPTPAARGRQRLAPYFVEEVRRWLQATYGDSSLYRAGLQVRTTLNPRMQEIANAAMDSGLRKLDKRQGWRGVTDRVPENEDLQTWEAPSWKAGLEIGAVTDGVVVDVQPGKALVRVGDKSGVLGAEQVAWTGSKDPQALFRAGDLIRVRVISLRQDGSAALGLEQEPAVDAALVALEPATGAVRALVGGFDFGRSEFDRAIQAQRQTGSAFKPFVFATALSRGRTLADTLLDEPTVFLDPRQPTPYLPKNYGQKYYGTVTLRRALEKSANVATVKLLNQIGANAVIETARRLGIASELRPYPSLALGSFETNLLELTGAYGTFANQGVRVEPHLVQEVEDRGGAVIFRTEPDVRDALSPQIAYLMNRLLEGVITDGTGRAAAGLGRPLAGKTGTTDGNTDAWFIGYSPDIAVGVWVGFDTKKSLGTRETGALAALPIWRAFMERAFEGVSPVDFERPPDMTFAVIDRDSGLKANPSADCKTPFSEAFVSGTEPTAYCSVAEHQRLHLPYPFQRHALNEQGEIAIPDLDLQELLETEPQVYLAEGGTRLESYSDSRRITLPLRIVPGGGREPLPEEILEKLEEQEQDPSAWIGTDGRRARVVFFRY